MRSIIIVLSGFLILISCNDKRVDRSTYEDELKSREIKKVTEADLFEKALQEGDSIATYSQKALGAKLKNAIQNNGVEGAITFCNINAYPIVDSLQKKYDATIRRVSKKYRNPNDKPDSLELALLESYEFNIEKGLEVKPNLQDPHDGKNLIFTKPIMINNPLCLQCHGTVGKELTEETNELISSLYPEDLATGYEMNQLRGMWIIRLSRKKLIIEEF